MVSPAISEKIKDLFDKDLTPLSNHKTTLATNLVDLSFVHTATKLEIHDLEACLNLIEETSGEDYKASSVGWNAKAKKKEMEDEEMMYILVRNSSRKRPHLSSRSTSQRRKAIKTDASLPSTSRMEHNQTITADGCNATVRQTEKTNGNTLAQPVTTDSQDILGFISFMFSKDDPPHEEHDVFYIYEIHMKEVLRGQGLGSKLIKFVENAAKQCGVSKTMLTVFRANRKAHSLYTKLGYSKDACSPKDRVIRKRVIEADYVILSKELDRMGMALGAAGN